MEVQAEYPVGGYRVEERGKNIKVVGDQKETLGRQFTIAPIRKGKWRLTGRSSCGQRRRDWFNAHNRDDAVRKAERMLYGTSYSVHPEDLRIGEVLAIWLLTRRRAKASTRNDYRNYIKYFVAWTRERGIYYWRELTLTILELYVKYLEEHGVSPSSIKKYLIPLTSGAPWAASKWGQPLYNFSKGLQLPRIERETHIETNPRRIPLTIAEVVAFAIWLLDQPGGWRILPGVVLTGLCALRMTEALRLTWDKIDLIRAIISIVGEIKNPGTARMIPIAKFAVAILKAAPKDGPGPLFGFRDRTEYSELVGKYMDEWNAERRIEPRVLRKTLSTDGEERGWSSFALDAYYGHSQKGERKQKYTRYTEKRMIALLRKEVSNKADQVISRLGVEWPK